MGYFKSVTELSNSFILNKVMNDRNINLSHNQLDRLLPILNENLEDGFYEGITTTDLYDIYDSSVEQILN